MPHLRNADVKNPDWWGPMPMSFEETGLLMVPDEKWFERLAWEKEYGEYARTVFEHGVYNREPWDAYEIEMEFQLSNSAGAGWPRCGCATQCESCWPVILVMNSDRTCAVKKRVSPGDYVHFRRKYRNSSVSE